MKKWVKNTLTIGLCLIPIGLVVGFSNSWSDKTPISCVGSSGVKPFVEDLAKKYQNDHKDLDITVEAGGSGFGIEQVAKNYANIGDASKDPYSAVKDGFQKEWTENRIKTITIGWEAICMVYIPPKDLEGLGSEQLNNLLTVDDLTIQNFMRIFTGWNEGITDSGANKLGCYYSGSDPAIQQKLDSTNVIPYVRSGGSLTSGTAASFVSGTHFDSFNESSLTPRQQTAFDSGKYGTSFGIQQTDEANSRAWDMFSRDNKPGQIVYLSSGFVEQNRSLIEKKGYGIMQYNSHPYLIDKVDETDANGGYNWFRPLNTVVALSQNDSKAEKFIQYAFANADAIAGCKKIERKDEKIQMFPDGHESPNTWLSDVDLAKLDPDSNWSDEYWPTDYHFSPIPKGVK